jgi:fatty aldehyde-generating acyl-ACP reductase
VHRFAFIVHPLSPKQAARRYPIARFLPDGVIERLMRSMRPQIVGEAKRIVAADGSEASGVFVGVPLTPRMMTGGLPVEDCYRTIVAGARLAASEGAGIVGLGAFTSVVGDGGVTVAGRSPIAVTTGNSYTVASAIEGTLEALRSVGGRPDESVLAVVGATGSIGRTCATVLAPKFRRTLLVGRDQERTQSVADSIQGAVATVDFARLTEADCIVTVTSSGDVIQPDALMPGAVVCDVARPRDVSVAVARARKDVLVVEGGVVEVPGRPDLGFDFGFPPGTAYACMAETMMLALAGRYESFTLGKDVSVGQVEETQALAARLGFRLAGLRSFERAVDESTLAAVRRVREQTAGRPARQPA